MGILQNIQQQSAQQPQGQIPPQTQQPQGEQGGMAQMYEMLMQNSMSAIADVAEQRIKQKGPVDGTADLVATAMIANLQAANQNGKAIPPQVLMQVAKDVAMQILQQMGVPEEQLDDVLIEVLFRALEQFGSQSKGMLSPEEEQQYVEMIRKISELDAQNQAQMQQGQSQTTEQQPMQ